MESKELKHLMDKLLHSELISEVKKLKKIVSELKIED